jgi:hypothetical protein
MIAAPVKPFPTYRWRWLSNEPTESLLKPEIFLGVLRTLLVHTGERTSSATLSKDLAVVQVETNSPVNLARSPKRNLFRNSGQYWKGTGLLVPNRGLIELTDLGKMVATGTVTQGEFAALMVQQTVLPNPVTYGTNEIGYWASTGLRIRPLALILQILDALVQISGSASAYLTNEELTRIVIPMAGDNRPVGEMVQAIQEFRDGSLSITTWPDCIPGANDGRLAREFLLFLGHYGLCCMKSVSGEERFYLAEQFDPSLVSTPPTISIFAAGPNTGLIVSSIRNSGLPALVERRRVTVSVLSRPQQSAFRTAVFKASGNRCAITGETITEILEAAHVIPVSASGSDSVDNGLCLRVDIHRLFDSGNIKISPSGNLRVSHAVSTSLNYGSLPSTIPLPIHLAVPALVWREKYW